MFYLCKSVTLTPVSSSSSLTDPTQTISSPSSETHNGIGFPQYLFLEKHQSWESLSQFVNLFYWIDLGTHVAFILFYNKLSFSSVTLINQVETAL